MPKEISKKTIPNLPIGQYPLEKNLSLVVKGNGNKVRRLWIFRYTFNKKRREMSLGNALVVSITLARAKAGEARNLLSKGIDPIEQRKDLNKEGPIEEPKILFKDYVFGTIEKIASVRAWKNKKKKLDWISNIEIYAIPILGDIPVSEITKDDILKVLEPIWKTKTPTASILRGRLERIFRYAITDGIYTNFNPATWRGNLDILLPSEEKIHLISHRKSLTQEAIKTLFKELYPVKHPLDALILFTILTASRVGETTFAKWSEFDLEKMIWTCPPERRKDCLPVPHRVPLTNKMVKIILSVKVDGSENVFYSTKSPSHFFYTTSPLQKIKRIFNEKGTMHGMRSAFRDWAAENEINDTVAEKCLMHSTGNKVIQAYQRSDLLEKRREVMQKWEDFLFEGIED